MEKDQLGFSCPRCGIDLTVPLSASGTEGPCPRCGSVIRAPKIVDVEKPAVPVRLEIPVETSASKPKPVVPIQPASPTFVDPAPVPKPGGAGLQVMAMVFVAVAGFALVLFAIRKVRELPDAAARISKPPATARPVVQNRPAAGPVVEPAVDPRVPPEGMDVTALITRSAGVLGRFLEARSLEERRPLMETRTPDRELAESILAKALPVTASFNSTEMRFNKVEGFADVVFVVPLVNGSGVREGHLMAVRTRGSQEPKVLADPFLDGFGGRLASFVENREEGEKLFRVVMAVFDFCTDETVPDHATKRTVKMSSHPGGRDVAKGYFSKQSALAGKYPETLLPFGRSTGATLVLRWTKGESPFIEVVDIKRLDWED